MKQCSFSKIGTSILFPSNLPVLLMLNIKIAQGRMATILREKALNRMDCWEGEGFLLWTQDGSVAVGLRIQGKAFSLIGVVSGGRESEEQG